jgi:hypothetical protein
MSLFTGFWIIVSLTAVLLSRNARYAVREYLANRRFLIFTLYMGFLAVFGGLVVHVASRVINLIQAGQETAETLEPTAYVSRRLRH